MNLKRPRTGSVRVTARSTVSPAAPARAALALPAPLFLRSPIYSQPFITLVLTSERSPKTEYGGL